MIEFSAETLVAGLSELDELIFKNGQKTLEQELDLFVQEFETKDELLTTDSLAKTFVDITTCDSKLKAANQHTDLSNTKQECDKTHQALSSVLDAVKTTQERLHKNVPFEQERNAFLKELEEKKKQMEKEIRKESDNLDEVYAKKTRESIYRNLVGSQAWFSLDS